jgi:CubicO group peptidase (beta-lactamase class C family)
MRLDLPHDSLIALFAPEPFDFDPGTQWRYNNSGYYLLGVILERVTGKPYDAYLEERLFRPLGLTGTSYCHVRPLIPHRAQGYEVAQRKLVNASYVDMGQPFSAGSLCSTVGDLVRWTRALNDGRVVRPASYARMTTPESLSNGKPLSYGYGLAIDSVGSHRRIQHGGGINGFVTSLQYYPDDTLTVVVLANTGPAPSDELATNIARLVFGMPLPKPRPKLADLPVTAAMRANVVGMYELKTPAGPRTFRVYSQGEQLFAQLAGQDSFRLLHQGQAVFGAEFDSSVRISFVPADAPATKFLFRQGEFQSEAPRVP